MQPLQSTAVNDLHAMTLERPLANAEILLNLGEFILEKNSMSVNKFEKAPNQLNNLFSTTEFLLENNFPNVAQCGE